MNDTDLKIIQFCAEEVARQGRGPIQVHWMVEAWQDAIKCSTVDQQLFLPMVQMWGWMIERGKNYRDRWRSVSVWVGGRMAPPANQVSTLMFRWHDNLSSMTPEEAYKEFEIIHPFADGNGRTGKIIYNWLKGTLEEPILPPDFFGAGVP